MRQVAEVRNFAVTVPHGTPQATPQVTALAMPARRVAWIRARIPPGPAGVLGWALGAAGVRVLPYAANQWIVGDNEVIEWELVEQISSGAWQLQGYNTGTYDHTVYITFGLELVTGPSSGFTASPLDLAAV